MRVNSSNASFPPSLSFCFDFRVSAFSFTTFSVTNILVLLPVCVFILHLGLRRWQNQRRASGAASHSDVFVYHMVAMEMISVTGCGLCCVGQGVGVPWLLHLGLYFFSATSTGQTLIHTLTCVERYLAVVRPITYLGLRNGAGLRIRNATIASIWLLFLGSFVLNTLTLNYTIVLLFLVTVVSMVIVSFCSLSVLRSLFRPGPGDGANDRRPVDQSKLRAFHTIVAITGTLLLRLGGHLLILVVYTSPVESEPVKCGVLVSGVWFGFPSSLVLPLLFLLRAGKLPCHRNDTESRQGSE